MMTRRISDVGAVWGVAAAVVAVCSALAVLAAAAIARSAIPRPYLSRH